MIYIYAAAALAFLAMGAAIGYLKLDLDRAEAQVQTEIVKRQNAEAATAVAVAANKQQQATITRMQATAAANDRLQAENAKEIQELNDRYNDVSETLQELISNEQGVRDFLDTPVPESIKRLHNPVGPGSRN